MARSTHAGRYGIYLEMAALRFAAQANESAGVPQCCFASRGPEREIGHARQLFETNVGKSLKATKRWGLRFR